MTKFKILRLYQKLVSTAPPTLDFVVHRNLPVHENLSLSHMSWRNFYGLDDTLFAARDSGSKINLVDILELQNKFSLKTVNVQIWEKKHHVLFDHDIFICITENMDVKIENMGVKKTIGKSYDV